MDSALKWRQIMKKIILILLIFLFIVACSNDWTKKPAPPYRPWATAMGVR